MALYPSAEGSGAPGTRGFSGFARDGVLGWRGVPAVGAERLIKMGYTNSKNDLAEADLELCVTGEIYSEYEEVIRRPRFNRTRDEIENALQALREKG